MRDGELTPQEAALQVEEGLSEVDQAAAAFVSAAALGIGIAPSEPEASMSEQSADVAVNDLLSGTSLGVDIAISNLELSDADHAEPLSPLPTQTAQSEVQTDGPVRS